jgi:hypothetical protein
MHSQAASDRSWTSQDFKDAKIPSYDEIYQSLQQMKVNVLNLEGLTEEEKIARQTQISESVMEGGLLTIDGIGIADQAARTVGHVNYSTFQVANKVDAGLSSAGTWVFAGIILAAKTGLDYRKLNNEEIDQAEFNNNLKVNTVATVGSVIGGTAGMAVGIPIGGFIADGIGAIVGAVVFGISGGLIGEKMMVSAEESLEQALASKSHIRLQRQPSFVHRDSFA